MRVLLIGGTGNISGECAAALLARGHDVFVLTRGKSLVPKEYRALVADRKDPAAMAAALKGLGPEVVINFLGFEPMDLEADYTVFRGNIRQYIFISSATVYAIPRPVPLTEDAPLGNPFWDYAQKKQQCEEWLWARWKEDHFPVTIVRPSHTYSKNWIPNAISSPNYNFAARLERGAPVFVHDAGESAWTLTAAADFAIGLAGLAGNSAALGEAFHITSDEALTWNQIYAEIAAALGAKSPTIVKVPTDFICQVAPHMSGPLKGDKAAPAIFDNSKIKRFVPEFRAQKNFAQGVRESVAWLRAHPELRQFSPKVDELCDQVLASFR